ncbi:hypothetical protein ES705_50910 [subsurface metagenome]
MKGSKNLALQALLVDPQVDNYHSAKQMLDIILESLSRIGEVERNRYRELEKAYELYLRTARLDLENYNNDTEDGVHITSMAGSWLAIVQGFAGMSVQDGQLKLSPYVPEKWDGYSFKIAFRGRRLKIDVKKNYVEIEQIEGEPLKISIFNRGCHSQTGKVARAPIQE